MMEFFTTIQNDNSHDGMSWEIGTALRSSRNDEIAISKSDYAIASHQQNVNEVRQGLSEIAFIDSGLEDYQTLVAGVAPGIEVVVLDSTQDGVEQISRVLAERQSIGSVHIVSHGAPGAIYIGNCELSLETLNQYGNELLSWAEILAPNAEVLIYGCEAAKGDRGQAFIHRLSELTGAAIAASATVTGCAALGGTWSLEISTGTINSDLAFSLAVQSAYTSTFSLVLRGTTNMVGNGQAVTLAIRDNLAYVAAGGSGGGLQIYDISNPISPVLVGAYDTPGEATDVVLAGNTAYVADQFGGLQIIDISNPATPTFLGSFNVGSRAGQVAVVDNKAYLTTQGAIQVFDVSDPSKPTRLGGAGGGGFLAVAAVGNIVYGGQFGPLKIYDFSNPASPVLLSSVAASIIYGITIVGNTAYLAAGAEGLKIVDISNPANPVLLGTYDTPSEAKEVVVEGNTAYIADWVSGVQVINVSNPASPTLIANYDSPGQARGLAVVDGLIYLADNGLLRIVGDNTPPTSSNKVINSLENTDKIFAVSDFPFTDADNIDTLQKIKITSLPTKGTLYRDNDLDGVIDGGEAIAINQEIAVSDLSKLKFKPASNASGEAYANFNFQVSDGFAYSSNYTMTLNVNAANGAPSFIGNANLATVAEDTLNPTGQTIATLFNGLFSDPDSNSSLSGVAVVGNAGDAATQGTWQYSTDSGANWFAIGTVADGATALALTASTAIRFVPATNYNGTPPALTVRAMDNTYSSAFTNGGIRVTVNTTTSGGATAIAATTNTINTSITAVNDAPTGTPTATLATGTEDTPYTINKADLLTGFSDVDGDSLSLSNVTANGTVLTADSSGNYLFTPAANFNGTVNLAYNVVDGNGGSVTATQSFAIAPVNDAPVLATNTLSITEGGTVTLSSSNLNTNDPDNTPAQLLYTISNISGGSFSGTGVTTNSNGTVSFTQAAINNGLVQFTHNGGENPPSYAVSVSDGALNTSPATVAIPAGSFTPVNDAPVLATNTLSITEGGTVTFSSSNLNTNDPDNTPAQLLYTISNISGGSFSGTGVTTNSNGTVSFSQAAINNGLVQFTHNGGENPPSYAVSVSDGALNTNPATVTIPAGSFIPVNDAPTVVGQGIEDAIISINQSFSLDISNNFSDVDQGNTLTYTATGLPTGFSLNANTGIVSGTISSPGIFNVNVTANDGNGGTVSDAFELIVANNNATPFDDIIYMSQLSGIHKDKINAKEGRDRVIGTSANEFIGGAEDADYLDGQGGNDKLLGGDGNDTLIGGLGSDDLQGGDGNDTLTGWGSGTGSANQIDELKGGSGADLYILGNSTSVFYNLGGYNDYVKIVGFEAEDRIQLKGTASDYSLGSLPSSVSTDKASLGIFTNSGTELIAVLKNEGLTSTSLTTDARFIFV